MPKRLHSLKKTKITLICGLFLQFVASINSNNRKYKIDEINTNYNRNKTILIMNLHLNNLETNNIYKGAA